MPPGVSGLDALRFVRQDASEVSCMKAFLVVPGVTIVGNPVEGIDE